MRGCEAFAPRDTRTDELHVASTGGAGRASGIVASRKSPPPMGSLSALTAIVTASRLLRVQIARRVEPVTRVPADSASEQETLGGTRSTASIVALVCAPGLLNTAAILKTYGSSVVSSHTCNPLRAKHS